MKSSGRIQKYIKTFREILLWIWKLFDYYGNVVDLAPSLLFQRRLLTLLVMKIFTEQLRKFNAFK